MRSKRWLMLVGALVLAAMGWYFFGPLHRRSNAEPGGAAQNQNAAGRGGASHRGGPGGPAPVVAGTVEKKDVPIYLNGIGTAAAYNTVVVHPQVSGYLTKVLYQEGEDVKKGDLLGVIDPRPYQAQLDQAVAKKNGDEAQLNNAKVTLQRDTDLINKGVLDRQSFDTQRFLVDQLDAAVKGDQAAIDNAQTQLSYTQVTAPLDGRCGLRQTDEGNLVTGSSTLVVITQLKPISAIFTLPQQNVLQVNQAFAKGPLKVTALDATQKQPLEDGTLAVVNNQIDTTTGTVQLKANFDNEGLQLWPGQFVNVRLLVDTARDGLVVPASVVQRGPNGSFAYVIAKDNTVEMRPIEVGQIDGDQAMVKSGLKEGERVVVDGQYKLQPGSPVEVLPARSPAPKTLAQNQRTADPDQAAADPQSRRPSSIQPVDASANGVASNQGFAGENPVPATRQDGRVPGPAGSPTLSDRSQPAGNDSRHPEGSGHHTHRGG
ncbi:MAG TPA: efflux RND transporter periplasmic adaptor subunit [Chthoniobacterales bacterium]